MEPSANSAYYFFIGWGIIIFAFFGLNKFEGTRTILYYMIWLLVVLDVVTHYQDLKTILSNAGFETSSPQTNLLSNLPNNTVIHGV